nr:MAG TPA: hypothetical protein [Caudoviricetes sp.]
MRFSSEKLTVSFFKLPNMSLGSFLCYNKYD